MTGRGRSFWSLCLIIGTQLFAATETSRTALAQVAPPTDQKEFRGVASEAVGPPPSFTSKRHDNTDVFEVKASSGGWWRLFEYYNVTEKCEYMKFTLSVEGRPRHGEARIVDSDFEFKKFADRTFSANSGGVRDPRVACKHSVYPAKLVIYKPESGYKGNDEVVISVTDAGYRSREQFNIVVGP